MLQSPTLPSTMAAAIPPPLPYRTDADDLRRFVAARARGRTPAQIRALGFSAKSFEGTAHAAEVLTLVEDRNGDMSALGRRLALAEEAHCGDVLRDVVLRYPPYALLAENVLTGAGPSPTPLEWIETWWATHGFGSSESNRAEAAPVFARLLEAAGFGSFVQGRKGHPSRIEWAPAAASLLGLRPPASGPEADRVPATARPRAAEAEPPPPARPSREVSSANEVNWRLAPGRRVLISVPEDLTAAEKQKILRLLQLLLED
jgi:hypothetical protein